MEGIPVTFRLEILVGLDEPRDERPRERGEPLVPAQIGRDAAEHVAEEVLLGVHRGGAPVVPIEQLRERTRPDTGAGGGRPLRTNPEHSSNTTTIHWEIEDGRGGEVGGERLRRRRRRRWTARRGAGRRRA